MQKNVDTGISSPILVDMEVGERLEGLFDGRKCSYSGELSRSAIEKIRNSDPTLAQVLVDTEVVGAHSSTSGSLVGVLRHGLRPQGYLREHNIPLLTGANDEGSFGINVNSVSMFIWYDVADVIQDSAWYADQGVTLEVVNQWMINFREIVEQDIRDFELEGGFDESIGRNPRKAAAHSQLLTMQQFLSKPEKNSDEILITQLLEENFPVVYLMSSKNLTRENVVTVASSRGNEFAVRGGINQGDLVVLVSPEKVSRTQKIVNDLGQDIFVGSLHSYVGLEQRLFDILRNKYST